jgi:hypothetical protein
MPPLQTCDSFLSHCRANAHVQLMPEKSVVLQHYKSQIGGTKVLQISV